MSSFKPLLRCAVWIALGVSASVAAPRADDGGPAAAPAARASSGCVPSAHALCLNDGRFRVEARWAVGGREGPATARLHAEDTGMFYFFRATNLELMVKVLDACARHGHFWFFAGGLTDLEVKLKVTDTQTGTTREYVHERGRPFAPIQDTRAFATCP